MTKNVDDIRNMIHVLEHAVLIEVHGGDRMPGGRLNEVGKQWVIDGLRLLAEKIDAADKKGVDSPPAAR